MTMTEWVARVLIGLPATTHHEDAHPTVAGPTWYGPGRRPDLWTEDFNRNPSVWCFEAKAARRLAQRNMREGAAQLAALKTGALSVPHSRVLVGTSIDHRLFTLIEHETDRSDTSATIEQPAALYNITRSRLIVYLLLNAHGHGRLSTVTVAHGPEPFRYSELDEASRELRRALAARMGDQPYRGPLAEDLRAQSTEFLVAAVPGTGLRLGLSPGLFRACEGLMASLEVAIEEVSQRRPEWRKYGVFDPSLDDTSTPSDELEEARFAEFREAVHHHTGRREQQLADDYSRGAAEGPAVRDFPNRVLATESLEMYTNDTYIAVEPESILLEPVQS